MKSLQNISYKTLFAILFLALAGIVFFLKIGGKTQKVSAAWWDEMWHYRKAISITNSSGSNLTDFQVSISIGTSALIASGKMQTDCDDIRITDISGNLLSYWIEPTGPNSCNQIADTNIWVKASSLPTSGSTLYLYYGNSIASSKSSGEDTFIYFKNNFQTSDVGWNWSNGGIESGWAKTWATGADNPGSTMTWLKNIINITGQEVVVEFTVKGSKMGGTGHITTNVLFNPTQTTALYNNTNNSTIANGSGNSVITFGDYSGWHGKVGFDASTGQASNITNDTAYPTYQFNTDGWVRHVHKLTNSSLLLSGYSLGGLSVGSSLWTYNEKSITAGYTKPNNIILAIGEQYYENIWLREAFVRKYVSSNPIPSLQSEELGTGPIAYWKFDEGVGTTVYDSAGTNNGTLTGTTLPSWQTEENCISGKCLSFNGSNNQISISNPEQINTLGSFSVGGWIYMNDYPTNWEGTMFSKATANTNWQGFGFGVRGKADGTNKGKLIFYIESNPISPSLIHVYGTSVLNINKWYYISATYNKLTGQVNLYVNGKKETTQTINSNISDNSVTPYIGQLRSNYGVFLGLLDDIKFYNYARTADQIKQDYNSRGSMSGAGVNLGIKSNTAPSLKSSLVAHYKFDEGNGTTAYNSIGQKNGTLGLGSSGSPSWVDESQCITGKCLNYNATTFQNVQVSQNIGQGWASNNDFTLSLWFKCNGRGLSIGSTQYDNLAGLFAYGNGENGNGGFYLRQTSINCSSLSFDVGTSSLQNRFDTNITPNLNKWSHFVAIKNGDVLSLYQDKVLLKTQTFSGATWYVNPNTTSNIGSVHGRSINGLIDEVKIYNRALTDNEIKQDYNAGSAIQFGTTTQNIGGTTTSLEYCIPGDNSYCAPPIAEWKMDEGVGTYVVDTSGNNNTVTLENSPIWTQGKVGKSIQLNGSNQRGNAGNNISPSNITIETWVYRTSTNTNQGIIRKESTYAISLYNNTIQVAPGNNWTFYNTNLDIPLNTWTHITFNYDGSTMKVYKNGQLGWSANLSGSLPNNSNTTYIGYDNNNWWWGGKIDHFKIYNYARTPAQIAYDYNKGGPVGWWKFDECQGNIAYDWSGIGNTGTINIGSGGSQNSLGTCQVGTSAAWTNGASGKINSSLSFDGSDDYMLIPYSSVWKNKDFSASFWIKPSGSVDIETGYTSHWFYSPEGFGIVGYGGVWINNSSGRQSFSGCNFNYPNMWSHLTLTYNQDTGIGKFYVNSKLNCSISLGAGTTIPWNTSSGVYVGGTDSGAYNGPGLIDDIRIFPYTLTIEQVKQIYNGGAVNFR